MDDLNFKKRGCYWSVVLFLLCLAFFAQAQAFMPPITAFYYGNNPPLDKLNSYQQVVFQPDSNINPRNFNSFDRSAFAYVSVGEVESLNQFSPAIPKSWIIAENKTWQSLVIDQNNPDWQKYFIDHIITPLWNKGYTGFFLDTLDSYQVANLTPQEQAKQQAGLISIIRTLKTKYPQAKLIINRGFEILPQIKSLVDEVVAESLFWGWDNDKKQYLPISTAERNDLIAQLNQVKAMGLAVTVIDYLPPDQSQKAADLADKISALGFYPWITNSDLTALYLSTSKTTSAQAIDGEIMPRKILVFYRGRLGSIDDKVGSMAVTVVSMPLNYLGYVPVVRNILDPLPDLSKQEYAGIVMAGIGNVLGKEQQIRRWYLAQMHKGIPVVILHDFGFPLDNRSLSAFGLSLPLFSHPAHAVRVLQQSKMIGFEAPAQPRPADFLPLTIKQGRSLIKVRDDLGTTGDMAAITPWGGYALSPLVIQDTGASTYALRWVVNPFEFFKAALHLPNMPIPDTTTENGRRLFMAHIDGDSFANKGQWYNGGFVGEIWRDEIITHYNIPMTVSIIEGELAPYGLYPKLSPDLIKIARQIFNLPNVEIASHTFSHPFNWERVPHQNDKALPKDRFNLPIPNYHFYMPREIAGSVAYINKYLAPPGKQCKVMLWSGEADVDEATLALTYKLGLDNFNGGHTSINKLESSISNVSSLGVYEGPYFQVFSPMTNDFEITQGVKKPLYTMVDVINTFKLTDTPRRLKPIDIYNHFYAAQQIGGVKALHTIYDWALSQPVMNVYVSEFFDKVTDFNTLKIAKKDDGWLILTQDKLRELRIPKSMGYPDLMRSRNVIGYNAYNDDYYIHLGPGGESFLRLTTQAPEIPYLVDANARVTNFKRNKNTLDFSFNSYLPVKFTLANMQNCTVASGKTKITAKTNANNQQSYELPKGTRHDFSVQCS